MVQYQTILVGLDGSEYSNRALGKAVEIAEKLGCKLVLANVLDMQYFSTTWLEHPGVGDNLTNGGMVYKTITDYQRAYSREVIAAAKEKVPATVPYEVVCEVGSPRKELIHIIERYRPDLVVVGSSGMNEIAGMIVGSVSDYVVRHSPVAVLVVR